VPGLRGHAVRARGVGGLILYAVASASGCGAWRSGGRVKPWFAVADERLGRLKLNGRLLAYSPLSRFEELDFLIMGIDGNKTLWVNLRDFAGVAVRLPDGRLR
jgi:hypothetical protein